MEKDKFYPYYLLIPQCVLFDEKLNKTDCMVYGAIFYYRSLGHEKCIASNKEIGRISRSSKTAVSRSLKKLEEQGHIVRLMKPGELGLERSEIIPLKYVDVPKN